jgi:TetR/AcrR family transcriptional regulator, mexJK operon transcriptional repressor
LGKTIDTLSGVLAGLVDDGHLELDDPRFAAEHLIWLVLSIPLNRAMLLGDDHGVRAEDLDRYADTGVNAFIAAYGRALGDTLRR